MGKSHTLNGEIEEGLQYYYKSLKINSEHKFEIGILTNYISIIETYLNQGELDQTSELIKDARAIADRFGTHEHLASVNSLTAKYHKYKGNLELSLQYYEKALKTRFKENIDYAYLLNEIIEILLIIERKEAYIYLDKLEKLKQRVNNPIINHIYRVNEASFLMSNTNFSDKAAAMKKYDNIIQNVDIFKIVLKAFVGKINLLLELLLLGYEEQILEQINNSIQKMESRIKFKNDHISLIRLSLLKSKLWLIQQRPSLAMDTLNQAIYYAESKKLNTLKTILEQQKERVKEDMKWWQNFLKSNMEITNRMKMEDLRSYIKKAKDQM